MSKIFKFGCLGIILLVVLLVIVGITGSDDDDNLSTGNNNNSEQKEENKDKNDGTKTIDASSQQTTAQGLKIGLGDIRIQEDKIKVGINVENTTDGMLMFYPDQGSAVIGDIQLEANMFLTDGDVSGDIMGGVKKEAVLVFTVPEGKELDVKSVKEIKLMLGDVTTEDYMSSKDVTFTIPVE